jgi:hypothetical protein
MFKGQKHCHKISFLSQHPVTFWSKTQVLVSLLLFHLSLSYAMEDPTLYTPPLSTGLVYDVLLCINHTKAILQWENTNREPTVICPQQMSEAYSSHQIKDVMHVCIPQEKQSGKYMSTSYSK